MRDRSTNRSDREGSGFNPGRANWCLVVLAPDSRGRTRRMDELFGNQAAQESGRKPWGSGPALRRLSRSPGTGKPTAVSNSERSGRIQLLDCAPWPRRIPLPQLEGTRRGGSFRSGRLARTSARRGRESRGVRPTRPRASGRGPAPRRRRGRDRVRDHPPSASRVPSQRLNARSRPLPGWSRRSANIVRSTSRESRSGDRPGAGMFRSVSAICRSATGAVARTGRNRYPYILSQVRRSSGRCRQSDIERSGHRSEGRA